MAPPPKLVSVSVDAINNINNNNNNNGRHLGSHTLTSPIVATSHTCSRRYAEIFAAAAKKRGDALVEPAPYMLGVGGRLRAFEPGGGGVVKDGSAPHTTGPSSFQTTTLTIAHPTAPPTPTTPNNNSNNLELIVDLVGSESVHELRLQRQQFRHQPTAPLAHSQCSVETSSGSNSSSSSSVSEERRGHVIEELEEEEEGVRGRGGVSSCGEDEEGDEVDGEEGEEEEDEEETPCDIGLLERLIRSHPIWFLLGIQRAGAFHLLQGKEDGNFVVRQSSQTCTMAISVRLPVGKGPYIEHYLIEATSDGRFSLESSDNKFESIPALVAHYAQCCDELPVQLTLPRAVREAKNRQQLSSLALLGQEFWRYPMANPRRSQDNSIQQLASGGGVGGDHAADSCTDSQASSLSSFDSGCNNNNNNNLTNNSFSPVLDNHREQRNNSIILNLSPLSPNSDSQPASLMSTFKGSPVACEESKVGFSSLQSDSSLASSGMVIATETCTVPSRAPRPTPPNTLNLVCVNTDPANSVSTTIAAARSNATSNVVQQQLVVVSSSTGTGSGGKTPPPPPPRWAKPALSGQQQNFTVTTTVTFSMNQETTPPPHVEVSCVQVTPNITSPDDRSLQSSNDTPEPSEPVVASESQESLHTAAAIVACQRRQLALRSPVTAHAQNTILSPVSDSGRQVSHRRSKRNKRSQHYQESDILESPDIYCRSSVADKVSDYEDIWEGRSTFKHQHQPVLPTSPFSSPDEASLSSGTNLAGCNKGPVPDILERVAPLPTSAANTNRNRLKLSLNTAANTPGCASEPHTPEQAPATTPSLTSAHKQGSPFYAEPADAIRAAALLQVQRRGRPLASQHTKSHRHSDPAAFIQWPGIATTEGSCLERIDSKEELNTTNTSATTAGLSSSVDNLVLARHHGGPPMAPSGGGTKLTRAKPVRPPKVGGPAPRPGAKIFSDTSWAVDSSWEFIGNDDDSGSGAEDAVADESFSLEQKFPSLDQQVEDSESSSGVNGGVKPVTVMQIISQRLPELCLSPEIACRGFQPKNGDQNEEIREPSDCSANSRVSAYDNVSNLNNNNNINSNFNANKRLQNGSSIHSQISDNDDAQTIFSEPWDSSRWEHLLQVKREECQPVQTPTKAEERKDVFMSRTKTAKERLDPLLSPPRLQVLQKSRDSGGAGAAAIAAYTLQLAADKSTTFAQNIDRFIACTRESPETSPQVVMRNMRQFMSGMKNYLVKHGERQFEKQVEKERNKLKANEFLNLDAILESVMHKLVVRPLKEHLYKLFVDEFTHNGSIQLLADSIQYARTRPLHELGIRPKIVLPSDEDLITICHYLQRLQEVYSPLEKLEHLLAAISAIFESVKASNAGRGAVTLGADDFLPLFVWVLVQSGMVAAEVEADYMWGLLHSSLLSGEGAYYLTTLSSAVNVLKTMRQCTASDDGTGSSGCASLSWGVGCPLSECRSVLKIVVPDEMNGSIITKTLPVRPNMTTRDVCKIIAHKVRITNPQDYGLYKLVDGEETLLGDGECPQDVKGLVANVGKHCMFAYKRIDAKIAWPRTTSP